MPVDQQYLSGYFSTKRYNYVGQERNPVRREGGARGKLTTPQRRHNTAGARKVQFLWGVAKPGNLRRTWPNVRSPRTLLAALHLEFNSLAFFQSIKVQFLKTAAVEKHLLPICRPNEAKTSVADDSLDCALHKHLCLRMGTFVAGQSTWIRLPVKLPHLRLAATLPARKFFVKGMKRAAPSKETICHGVAVGRSRNEVLRDLRASQASTSRTGSISATSVLRSRWPPRTQRNHSQEDEPSRAANKLGPRSTVSQIRSGVLQKERLPGGFQVLVDFEDCAEPGNLQELMDSPRKMQEFQITTSPPRGSVTGD